MVLFLGETIMFFVMSGMEILLMFMETIMYATVLNSLQSRLCCVHSLF